LGGQSLRKGPTIRAPLFRISLETHEVAMRRASGIGRALADAALQAGHRLVATARDPKQLEDLSNRFEKSVCVTPPDVTDPADAFRAV
jgi:putative NADH-flavin reductase